MRAQVLTAARRPLAAAELPAPRPGPQQVLIAVRACAVCRTDLHVVDGELARSEIAARARARDHRHDRRKGGRGRPFRGRRPGRRAVARLDLRGLRILPQRPREFVRPRAFTGYQIDGGYAELTVADQRYCFAIDPRLRRRRGGAADVRRADRLPHAAHGRRCAAGRDLRLRRRRPHRRAGHPPPRPPAVRVHPPGRPRRRRISPARSARNGPGARPAAARAARRRADLRAGRRAGAGGARRHKEGRHRRQRRHPYERHSVLSRIASCGRSACCARSPT